MDPSLLILLAIAVAVGIAIARARSGPTLESAEWGRVADELGLAFSPGGLLSVSTLVGQIEGFSVRAERYSTGGETHEHGTRIVVRDAGIDPELRIRRASNLNWITRGVAVNRVKVGDPIFDDDILVEGRAQSAAALLGERNRSIILRRFTSETEVVEGEVHLKVQDQPEDARGIADLIRLAVSIAQASRLEQSEPDCLARNVEKDPEPGVRRGSLELLIRHHPGTSAATDSIRKALNDADPEIRLLAATHDKGMYGQAALERLVEGDEDDGLRARALTELARAYGTAVAPIVRKVLEVPGVALRRAAIEAVALLHDVDALEGLCAHLPTDPCAVDCARALELLGDARAEPALLRFLTQGDGAVRVAAAKALGKCGSISAVEPLLEHARGLLLAGDLKEAARDAVRAIQARLGDVEAGRLALADPMAEQGGLSVVSGEGEKSR